MYQLTYFDSDEFYAVSSPNYRALEELYFALPRSMHCRLWNVSTKGAPRLLA